MPSLLTHERFREELRLFARGALRAELKELGDRVRREVLQELRALQAEQQLPITPASVVRKNVDGGSCPKIHETPRSRQPTGDLVLGRVATTPTTTSELHAFVRSAGQRENQPRRGGDDSAGAVRAYSDEADSGIMKSLKSYKVAETIVGSPRRGRRPENHGETGKPSPKSKPPASPALLSSFSIGNLASLAGRQKSGEAYSSPNAPKERGKNKPEASGSRGLHRTKTADSSLTSLSSEGAGSPGRSSLAPEVPEAGVAHNVRRNPCAQLVLPDASDTPDSPSPSSRPATHLALPEPSRKDFGWRKIHPQNSPKELRDPDSPRAPAPLLGIVPAPCKVSWGETEPCSECTSEVCSPTSEAPGELQATPTARHKTQDAGEPLEQSSSSVDPFGGQMEQLYFQRDWRPKTTSASEVGRRPSSIPASLDLPRPSSGSVVVERSRLFHFLEAIVENSNFHICMAFVIFANLLTVGMQTDYLAQHMQEKTPVGYIVAEAVFCIIFVSEVLARLYLYGRAFFVVPGRMWNIFDCSMALLQLTEQVLEILISTGSVAEGGSFSFSFLRALRILRVIRLLRAARVVEHVRELQTIVLSIGSSVKSLMWTIFLLALLIFTIGVSFTQLVLNHRLANPDLPSSHVFNTNYSSLGASILTLYGSIMGGVDWLTVADPLLKELHPILGVVFSFYVAFAVLAMMNVVTGVFVEASLKTARDHHEALILSSAKSLFKDADLDESGQVTWTEFQHRLDHPHMHEFFKSIDVDISEAETVFHLLDFGENGRIDVDQFMGGCLRLRGPAKAVDLAMLMYETRRMARRQSKQVANLHQRLAHVTDLFNIAEGQDSELNS